MVALSDCQGGEKLKSGAKAENTDGAFGKAPQLPYEHHKQNMDRKRWQEGFSGNHRDVKGGTSMTPDALALANNRLAL